MTTKHPTRALGYSGTSFVANEAADLGTSGTLENYTSKFTDSIRQYGGGILDASADKGILVHLTWPAGTLHSLGDLSDTLSYTAAAGLFFSPLIDTQQPARTLTLQDLCDASNVAPFWSDGLLKFIPYGDKAISGNGHFLRRISRRSMTWTRTTS
jgi:hypothetical protein